VVCHSVLYPDPVFTQLVMATWVRFRSVAVANVTREAPYVLNCT
jgi:hypothetical protein